MRVLIVDDDRSLRDDASLDALAERLGVSSAKLRAAFEDLRPREARRRPA